MATIGIRVRSLREHKNWSQEDLARESKLKRPHISLIENDERTPGANSLVKLADALGTSIDFLAGRIDNPNPRPIPKNLAMRDPGFAELADAWPKLPKAIQRPILNIVRGYLDAKGEPPE